MTFNDALSVWRELLQVTRLIAAVETVTKTEHTEAVWQAGLVALEQRRGVLAVVLSVEPPEFLQAVYARLATEVRGDAAPVSDDLQVRQRPEPVH